MSDRSNVQDHETPLSDAVLSAAHTATADIAVITDGSHLIIHVSASFTAMTGYEPVDVIGRNCRVLQGPNTAEETRRQIRDCLGSAQVFEGQILNYRKDGSAFWSSLKIIPIRRDADAPVTHFVSVQRDISNRMALLKQLEFQTHHDQLTGLPHRASIEPLLTELAKESSTRGQTAAVGLINLDQFRRVNQTVGYAVGDSVMAQWATRVVARMREGDVLARMGGDEFLLILGNLRQATPEGELTELLHRIHGAVEEPFLVGNQLVRIQMSAGIVLSPEWTNDSLTILSCASDALREAKNRTLGASWWTVAPPLSPIDAGVVATVTSAPGVESVSTFDPSGYVVALKEGNVLVEFQPVIDLRDGSVHLFEALARLRLADGRTAYPNEFLPHFAAEDLAALFASVLDQALGVLATWDRDGSRHDLSVNLPPEILHSGTVELTRNLLLTHKIEPRRLGLELLESQTVGANTQVAALQELVGLGVALAMDDLGSGYSSLQRLASHPFSAIKLDRGLLTHIYSKPVETLGILASLIQLGRDLQLDVVVEGLEDDAVTEAVTILGAPLGQGYYFSKPIAAEECRRWHSSFEFRLDRYPLRTALGALAYHWQFARLAAPHSPALLDCPLTGFMEACGAPDDVGSWHALQHTQQGLHHPSSRILSGWLISQIHNPSTSPNPPILQAHFPAADNRDE